MVLEFGLNCYADDVRYAVRQAYVDWESWTDATIYAYASLHVRYPARLVDQDLVPLFARLIWNRSYVWFAKKEWIRTDPESFVRFIGSVMEGEQQEKRRHVLTTLVPQLPPLKAMWRISPTTMSMRRSSRCGARISELGTEPEISSPC